MEIVSMIFLCVILFENVLTQPMQHVILGDQGQHIDVGDEDYHDGDDDVDYTDDVDDVDDSHGSPSQLLQGGYQRNQHYGGGNYHSGYFRPNKQYEISYGDLFPNKHASGYKH
uniref:Immunogenic miracidial antigen 8I n=1 Tax=Schistosoma japonicum TaxID=6182 RepID=C1LN74_SCHJA|nr:Immunogenic miracidial antigen 8I' [Schistosoma japonicum]